MVRNVAPHTLLGLGFKRVICIGQFSSETWVGLGFWWLGLSHQQSDSNSGGLDEKRRRDLWAMLSLRCIWYLINLKFDEVKIFNQSVMARLLWSFFIFGFVIQDDRRLRKLQIGRRWWRCSGASGRFDFPNRLFPHDDLETYGEALISPKLLGWRSEKVPMDRFSAWWKSFDL